MLNSLSASHSEKATPTNEALASQAGPDAYHILSVMLGRAFPAPIIQAGEEDRLQRDLKQMRAVDRLSPCADKFEQCLEKIKSAMEHYKIAEQDKTNKEELDAGNTDLKEARDLLTGAAACIREASKPASMTTSSNSQSTASSPNNQGGSNASRGRTGSSGILSLENAGNQASDFARIPTSFTNTEFGGYVYQTADGTLHYTPPVSAGLQQDFDPKVASSLLPIWVTDGTSNGAVVSDYHGHPVQFAQAHYDYSGAQAAFDTTTGTFNYTPFTATINQPKNPMGTSFSAVDVQAAIANRYPVFISAPNGTNYMYIPPGIKDGNEIYDPGPYNNCRFRYNRYNDEKFEEIQALESYAGFSIDEPIVIATDKFGRAIQPRAH